MNNLTVYEMLHVIFTQKDRNFTCSIASLINTEYIFPNQYNTGFLNPHIDVKVLKHNSGTLNVQDAYYFHNGQVDTTTRIVKGVFKDRQKNTKDCTGIVRTILDGMKKHREVGY